MRWRACFALALALALPWQGAAANADCTAEDGRLNAAIAHVMTPVPQGLTELTELVAPIVPVGSSMDEAVRLLRCNGFEVYTEEGKVNVRTGAPYDSIIAQWHWDGIVLRSAYFVSVSIIGNDGVIEDVYASALPSGD